MIDSVRTRMTAQEFFQLPETNRITELIHGELLLRPPHMPAHQMVVRHVLTVVQKHIPGGEILFAPLSLYLDDENIPAPDVMWIAEGGKCKVGEKYLEGPPDLIVEVLSPSTARYDKTVKFLLYEKFGVREYWIADPNKQQVEVWCLKGTEYELHGTYSKTDTFESPVLNSAKIDLNLIF